VNSSENNPQEIKAVVVDDEEDTLDSICQTLEIGGINVVGKGQDGEQAYQLYKTMIPDIIIIDMNMPNYDGGYALEKIMQDYPDAKIIVVTAFTDYTFEKAKAAAIITKPYDFEPFLDTVKKVAKGEITSPIIK
jgi:two-component system chemotaxis response regulator CheY